MKRKVLLAVTHAGFGGVARHVADLAGFLNEQPEWEASIACGSQNPELLSEFRGLAKRVFLCNHLVREMSPQSDILALKEVSELLRSEDFDVVHSHGPKAGLLFRFVAHRLGIPNLYTHHLVVYRQTRSALNGVYRQLEKRASQWCDKVITVTETAKKTLIEDGVTPESKLTVIYNGISSAEVGVSREQARETLGIRKDEFIAVSVARLEEPKDPVSMLRGFLSYRKGGRTGKLVIVGDGPLKSVLQKMAGGSTFKDDILFVGFTHQVELYLAASDVFVLCTKKEGLPISVLEAMKNSLPIIASSVDGIPEQVTDGYNGFLCSVGDSEAVARALEDIFDNPALRHRLGEQSRIRVIQDFMTVDNYPRVAREYEEAINANARLRLGS